LSSKIGSGAYGVVWKVIAKRSRKKLALKKIFDAFENATDAQRTYREIMLLKHLRHDNIVKLLNVYKADNDTDIYLVFPLLETDLSAVIRAGILEEVHKRYIIYQLVKTLKYLHSGNLIHRDIKPSNMLLNSDCHMVLCDFGLARTVNTLEKDQRILTDYVATRWYRDPFILMGCTSYDCSVDMWAVGCICCELYLGKPMFRGSSTMNQLQRIVTLIGKPSNEDIARIPSEYAQSMLDSIPHGQLKDLKHCFPKGIDADALDFITKLLQFMPENRMTAEEALKHPYLKKFYKTSEEPTCEQVIKLYFNDNSKYTVAQYRDKLYQEIKKRRERRKTRTTDSRAGSRTGSSSTTTTTSSSGTRSVSRSGSSIGHRSTSSSSYARSRRS